MFRSLFHTPGDHALFLLRGSLGAIFFAHGAQKMLGWFGGSGFTATLHGMNHGMGIPEPLAVLAILAEFMGGIGLLLGLLSRVAAFGTLTNMVVALLLVHLPNGLFMNWTGSKRGEGFEFHILAIAMSIVILVRGAGAWSLDRVIARQVPGDRPLPRRMHPQPIHG